MNKLILKYYIPVIIIIAILGIASCTEKQDNIKFDNILDISYTPDTLNRYTPGCFTDLGSWMGFSIPQNDKWVNGFIGPFSFYEYGWKTISVAEASFKAFPEETFLPDSINYYPGGVYISASSEIGRINQELIFATSSIALLNIKSNSDQEIIIKSNFFTTNPNNCFIEGQTVRVNSSDNEDYLLIFPEGASISETKNGYEASIGSISNRGMYIVIAQLFKNEESNNETAIIKTAQTILTEPENYFKDNRNRWNSYISEVLRNDLEYSYDRIAVKSIVTLISNWRSAKDDLFHDGVIPSHAAGYFVGYWAWDSWKIAVALSRFEPELAKNTVRSMFDYQLGDGMVIDCIYTDSSENNYRDSKPPLAAWAVNEIYEQTGDKVFLQEMYPKLKKYFDWWYAKRDHNNNGICEFGSVDGTLEAAAWESGMDNAIRFDNTEMVQNGEDAWSMNQENVDLNFYLAYEEQLLEKFAQILEEPFEIKNKAIDIVDYFYDEEDKFFYDRNIFDQSFIKVKGCEAYTPFWTGLATHEQFKSVLPELKNENMFSTYIPFPTASADEEKFSPRGYWRGPIWLDQTYFAINGLRKYGKIELADDYTRQVFERLEGLQNGAPIHENYDPHTGKRLKASNFSWSAAHLLLLYEEFGKTIN